ncbi:MAG: hypothetical protein ACREHV_13275 [Rhizomicrobium sp.]
MLAHLPPLAGRPISVSFRRGLTAHRGKLVSRAAGRGTAVYAVSFVRQRKIVFDASLSSDPPRLRFFAVHEVFHFVWTRLGNPKRAEFARLLALELVSGAQGELGESSVISKARLRSRKSPPALQPWRDYVCESFCDTAAWLYAGAGTHGPVSLAGRWRNRRRSWFTTVFSSPRPC